MDYFAPHDMISLPQLFVERLGELLEHGQINHLDEALEFRQRVVKESRSFVSFISDPPIGHSLHEEHSHFSRQTSLRILLPKSVDTELFRSAKNEMGVRLEIGLLEEVKLALAMNENIAAFGLRGVDGRID